MEGLLIKKKEGQGGLGKIALSSSFPRRETGEEGAAHRQRPGRRSLGHGGGRGVGQKDEESEGVLFPVAARADVERGGLATRAGEWRVAVALGWRPGGTAAVKGRGKVRGGREGPISYLGSGRGAAGGSYPRRPAAVAELSAEAALGARGESWERWWSALWGSGAAQAPLYAE